MGGAGPLAVELWQCARHCTRRYSCQKRCLTLAYRRRDFADMYVHPGRKNCTNPAFSLPPRRRPKSRSKHTPPSPSRAHSTTQVLRRTALRPHQGIKSGKQRASRLRTMTLADVEEHGHVEGQVPKQVALQDYNILRASDANRQRTSADSLKQSTTENTEPGLMGCHETCGDEVR